MEYKNLEYICIFGTDLSIIEAGTFDYNPEIQFINFGNNKFLHIDPSAFKSLAKLNTLQFHLVPCIDSHESGKHGIDNLLKRLETRCKNPKYLSLHQKFKNLESQPRTAEFNESLEIFRQELKSSGYFANPSFKVKFEALKSAKIDDSITQINPQITPTQDSCTNCCKNVTVDLKTEKYSTSSNIEDSGAEIMIDEIKSMLNDQKSKLSSIQSSQEYLKVSQNTTALTMTEIIDHISNLDSALIKVETNLQASQQNLKLSQESIKSSQDEVINDLGNLKIAVSDVELTLNKIKSSQNELQSSMNKLRMTQNEIGIAIDKMSKSEDFDGKSLRNNEICERNFEEFEVKNNQKFDEIKQDLAITRHKIEMNLNEKITNIEKRLIKKIEDILEEKLAKIFEEKLSSIVEARGRT
jgi:hypothetical protein